jgi:tungstate transport system permease protein
MLPTVIDAFWLLGSLDREVVAIAALSLRVSLAAVLIGATIGLPLGAWIAIRAFPGRGAVISLLNACMGLPAVVVGLLVYLLLSRSGPLGPAGILFTPAAMVLAQAILVTPLIAALTRQMVEDADRDLGEQLRSLRSEVGAVLVVGGNIAGHTRTMTTAISLETQKGDLPLALALGMVLIGIVILVNGLASGLRTHAMRVYG